MPQVRVEGPGATVINPRIESWTRTDVSGEQSDKISIVVNTSGQDGLPPEGAKIQWFEGYDENLSDKGTYTITSIHPTLEPPTVTITATSAPWQVEDQSRFKERRNRSFTDMTLGDVFREVVEPHGFSPRVDPQLDSFNLEHVDQVEETDASFLTRLARERDAVAKPVGDLYVLAKRGQVSTISGQDIQPVNVEVAGQNIPSNRGFINCRLQQSSRKKLSGVRAVWVDSETGQEMEVTSGSEPFKRIRQPFQSLELAQSACDDELKRIEREGDRLMIDLPGDPNIVAEGLIVLGDSFDSHFSGKWSIDEVVARGSISGAYRCSVIATSPER